MVSIVRKGKINICKMTLGSMATNTYIVYGEKGEVKEDVQELKREMGEVKQGVMKIMLIIENELQPTMKLLVENFLPAAAIYVENTKKITYLEQDVTVLKKVVGEHSKKLSTI